MPDDPPSIPGATPSNYQRTTGGNLRWKPPTVERLQELLAGYEVIGMLGHGGMGAVYKARQISLDRLVAIKILPPEAAGDEEAKFVERFRNEARTMAKMNHPAIVSVYDFGETSEGQLYIVMEFVDGTDVSKMILSQGRLPPEYALAITAHVCDALQYAHTHGVIHRDIKPANVLINMEGAVKVADFGLAKAADAGQGGLTKTNMAMGTPDFVAPEALIAGMTVDGRADLYAVGVMLYNMLTGNVPRGMFRMPSTMLATDPRFDQIITKSMEMDRDMRYQTAFDIRRDLDVILTTPQVQAGGQSSAAIPKHHLLQKPAAKGPQKPMGKSAKVPVRSSQRDVAVAGVTDPGVPDSTGRAAKKSKIGPIIGIAATVMIGAGLFFVFKPKPPPGPSAALTQTTATPAASNAPAFKSPSPSKVENTPPISAPAPSTTASAPPPASVKQTIDLLALTDPGRDRIPAPGSIDKNEWVRENGTLVYKSDGKAGKLAAPVALNCRDYEIELRAERLSGNERIHMDVPLDQGRILPLILNAPNRKVLNEREGLGSGAGGGFVHVTARVMLRGDMKSDRIIVQRKDNGTTMADWTGELDKLGKPGEAHPQFPGQPLASIFTSKVSCAVKTWTLRVFDGEAKILREESAPLAATTPAPTATKIPTEPVTFGGHRYQFMPELMMGVEAAKRAQELGGNLVGINSKEEQEFLIRTFAGGLPDRTRVWIGGRMESGGEWNWLSGEPFTYTNWLPGKPDGSGRGVVMIAPEFRWDDDQSKMCASILEWDDGKSSSPVSAAVNLLASDVKRDVIEGDWKLTNGELIGSGRTDFSRITFNVPVPEEYDFRIVFTRKTGNLAVAQHLPFKGRDVMWLMGGFNNSIHGLETISGALGNANATTVRKALQTGRRYQSVVKVRRNRITVILDGEVVANHKTDGSDLGVVDKWKFPDPRKLGVGCQRETVFHSIDMAPFRGSEPAVEPETPLAAGSSAAAQAAPIQPPSDPRVAQLEAGFKGRYEADAQKPYLAAVAALNKSYVSNGISRARIAAQQRGALDEVTALDGEKQRVEKNEPLPPADLDTLPESLKQLRTTYRGAIAKIEADRTKKSLTLYDIYLGALDAYITELTKANKIEQAQEVKRFRDQVAAQKAALSGDAAATLPAPQASAAPLAPAPQTSKLASAASASPQVPIPPEVLAPPIKGRYTRELVEWVTKRNSFRIGWVQGNRRGQLTEDRPGELPNGAGIVLIDIGNQGGAETFDAAWLEGQTDMEQLVLWRLQDFKSPAVLRGMKKLQMLRVSVNGPNSSLDDEAMRSFPPLPELNHFNMDGAFSNLGLRVICERCPRIQHLQLSARLTEGALLPLSLLKELRTLIFTTGSNVHGPEIKTLASLPKLESLQFNRCKITGQQDLTGLAGLTDLGLDGIGLVDSEVNSITGLKKLTTLSLTLNEGITDAAIPAMAPFSSLTQLRMGNCRLTGLGGAAMPVFPALELCHLQGNAALNDTACAALAKQKNLKSLYLNGTAVGDVGVQALSENLRNLTDLNLGDTKVTDAGIPALRRLEKLESLWLDKTSITDASIETLKKLVGLKELHITGTRLTPEGLAKLAKALPQTTVVSK